jgi:hypothetical protein
MTPQSWKRDQNNRDRFQKAQMLRNYAKLCKREGVLSQRVNMGGAARQSEESISAEKDSKIDKSNSGRPNPYLKYEKKAKLLANSGDISNKNLEVERKRREAEILKAAQNRKSISKVHMARTSKGQPLLSKISTLLLQKISARK